MTIKIDVPIRVEDLTHSLSREEALYLIKQLDARFADVDFTLELIEYLIHSLQSDMAKEEIKHDILEFIEPTTL
jgi:hypothetical protein